MNDISNYFRKAREPEKVAGAVLASVLADDLFLIFCFFFIKEKEKEIKRKKIILSIA